MRFDGIQCLRAVAAMLVIWVHLGLAGSRGSDHLQMFKGAAGACGVDVFFVISGFVISMSAVRLGFDWRAFLTNRLCRIAPFYWLMSAPLALGDVFFRHLNWRALANSITFIPLLDFNVFQDPIHGCGWTLSFEFWFYSLFAALIAAFGARVLVVIAPLLVVLCVIVSFGYRGSWFAPSFLFHPLMLEFAAGILIYNTRRLLGARSMAIAAILAIVFGSMVVRTRMFAEHDSVLNTPASGWERALIWGGFGAALVIIVVSVDNLHLIRWPRWLIKLGDCSYSIYLIQPYGLLASAVVGRLHGAGTIFPAAVFAACTILGGILVSNGIEVPLTHWTKQQGVLFTCRIGQKFVHAL